MAKMEKCKPLLDKLEVALSEVLPEHIERAWMHDLISCDPESIEQEVEAILQPARDLLCRGGKRWRALVMLRTLESFGVELTHDHFLLSLCIELPHNGSLMIDDIEDKSDKRRGESAIHKIYGEDTTINTGNFLYFLPTYLFEKIAVPTNKKEHLILHWLKVMRCLHIGQGLDIHWHKTPFYLPSRSSYMAMCRWKTGALPSLAGYWGALLGGASVEISQKIADLWASIGVGFQILDDTTNLTTGNVGKRKGDDLIEGKKSYPLLVYGSEKNPTPLLEDMRKLRFMKDQKEQDVLIESLIGRLEEEDSLKISYKEGRNLLLSSQQELRESLPKNEASTSLWELLESFLP